MCPNFKDINIGNLINLKVMECGVEMPRICNFFSCTSKEILEMYDSKDLPVSILLKWSKLLKYDFFRLYSQHLILYAPVRSTQLKAHDSKLPIVKKNLYTKEIIDFVLELIRSGQKTRSQVVEEYNIPKTTLSKWLAKYEVNPEPFTK